MKVFFKKVVNYFFPEEVNRQAYLLFFICIYFKFVLFDLIWSSQTTFTSFSFLEGYLNKLWFTLLFLIPLFCFRAVKWTLFIAFLLDILFIVNLMYFRTYFTAIPLDSYGLVGNLKDFTASVYDSVCWIDAVFPLSTLLTAILYYKKYKQKKVILPVWKKRQRAGRYLLLILVATLFSGAFIWSKGGFKAAYESLQGANKHTCDTPIYTVFGSLYYDYLLENIAYTPEIKQQIEAWLKLHPRHKTLPFQLEERNGCILILAESLESWVLEKTVEGVEITPCMNALLKEKSTLYASKVLTQVKGGRSIDAQLLLYSGLLPIGNGSYSTKFPRSLYPSFLKYLKNAENAKIYGMMVDKEIVWNQKVICPALGFDSLISRRSFVLDEKVGPRKKLGDLSFLRQCGEKISSPELWPDSAFVFLQCVTYSGHNPFILPEELKRVSFSDKIPKRMNDYMTMANYTDRAIGNFIAFLRSQRKFDKTLIVITGDHEGLANSRGTLCCSEKGKDVVSSDPYVPFIVVNSPVGMRYDKVMGQIDMYPTLLDLLGLRDCSWTGLGRSILDPDKKAFAVSPQMQVYGDIAGVPESEIEWAKEAWKISDLMIRCDYFRYNPRDKWTE
ncbi:MULTISPECIES: LTA synthase family protein [Sanguibacteroides]|uniref:LTA synthase family protein n=1 Tax=Sanguibacteroides TaxID=1635148 RepID=UPI000D9B1D35|nr:MULTISPECIES: LTA synthase family protein [Sanguibacteroides]PXZ44244.1 arylsulfatase [Sanguibacteroides justesenii]